MIELLVLVAQYCNACIKTLNDRCDTLIAESGAFATVVNGVERTRTVNVGADNLCKSPTMVHTGEIRQKKDCRRKIIN